MTGLSDEDLRRAACHGINPRTMYEDAWNDKAGRPAPGLAKALSICDRCPVREPCAVAGIPEPYGVWGGTVPPERGYVRGVRHATDEEPLTIIRRLGETLMQITPLGNVIFTAEDFPPERPQIPGQTIEDIDRAMQEEWRKAAAEYGSYHAVPADVRERIGEDHRKAHVARVDAEKKAMAAAPKKPAGERPDRAACPKGHDLTVHLPNGKPMLTTTGKCRMCLKEYDQRRKAERQKETTS